MFVLRRRGARTERGCVVLDQPKCTMPARCCCGWAVTQRSETLRSAARLLAFRETRRKIGPRQARDAQVFLTLAERRGDDCVGARSGRLEISTTTVSQRRWELHTPFTNNSRSFDSSTSMPRPCPPGTASSPFFTSNGRFKMLALRNCGPFNAAGYFKS